MDPSFTLSQDGDLPSSAGVFHPDLWNPHGSVQIFMESKHARRKGQSNDFSVEKEEGGDSE